MLIIRNTSVYRRPAVTSRTSLPVDAAPRHSLFAGIIQKALKGVTKGRLVVVLPSGERVTLQGAFPGVEAELTILKWRAVWKLIWSGDIGFGVGYRDGDWCTHDLKSMLLWAAQNEGALNDAGFGLDAGRLMTKVLHFARSNTRANSRRNISEHYDLGNAFYAEWLDSSMSYSSAVYSSREQTLEQAQSAKLDRIIELLELKGGERVLEIGCGWGALAERLILSHGCHVTGLTLSAPQRDFTIDRLTDLDVDHFADIRLQDYRDVTGQFDRVVSIEMIEAVGEAYWDVYFSTLRDCLKPGGIGVLQAITIEQRKFDVYRRQPDFIQSHVFPGGMLPTDQIVQRQLCKVGLTLVSKSNFGQGYALTLAAWRERFEKQWSKVQSLGFDLTFRRLWNYYLVYCETGFETGSLDVGHYKFERKNF